MSGISGRGGRFSATGASLKLLIRTGYRLQDFQIIGGPDWLDVDRFDVIANVAEAIGAPTSPDGPTRQPVHVRVQSSGSPFRVSRFPVPGSRSFTTWLGCTSTV